MLPVEVLLADGDKGRLRTPLLDESMFYLNNDIACPVSDSYKSPDSGIFNTGIPQSRLVGKGLTAAFILTPNSANTGSNGLVGIHNSATETSPGLAIQYCPYTSMCPNKGYLVATPNRRGRIDNMPFTPNKKTFIIFSDSAENTFGIMDDGEPRYLEYYFGTNRPAFTPFSSICLFRSYYNGSNTTIADRCFQGTVHSVALFDRGLSVSECRKLKREMESNLK